MNSTTQSDCGEKKDWTSNRTVFHGLASIQPYGWMNVHLEPSPPMKNSKHGMKATRFSIWTQDVMQGCQTDEKLLAFSCCRYIETYVMLCHFLPRVLSWNHCCLKEIPSSRERNSRICRWLNILCEKRIVQSDHYSSLVHQTRCEHPSVKIVRTDIIKHPLRDRSSYLQLDCC